MVRMNLLSRAIPALVICLAAAAPASASADSDRGRDWNARGAQAGQPIYFKPGTFKGQTTQDLPVSFKATKKRLSRFSAEIELHCYSPAPAGSGQLLVHERSYREMFTLPNGKYGVGAITKQRNFFRFSEQPDANTSFSSAAVFLKGKRAYGDLFVRRTEGETQCQAARRDIATGEFTELTSSFEIRRRK